MNENINQAVAYIKQGQMKEARLLLKSLLKSDPANENAWLLLSLALESEKEQQLALKQVLKLNSQNQRALQQLRKLQTSTSAQPKPVIQEPLHTPSEPDLGTESEDVVPDWMKEKQSWSAVNHESVQVEKSSSTQDQKMIAGKSEDAAIIPSYLKEDKEKKSTKDFSNISIQMPPKEMEILEPIKEEKRKKQSGCWVVLVILILLLIGLGAAGFFLQDQIMTQLEPLLGTYLPDRGWVTPLPADNTTPTIASSGVRTLPPTMTSTPSPIPSVTPTPTSTSTPTEIPTFAPIDNMDDDELLRIREQVMDVRGLTAKDDQVPSFFLITNGVVTDIIRDLYITEDYIQTIPDETRVLVALGLVKPTYDRFNAIVNSYVDGIGGFYVPESESIYVIGLSFNGLSRRVYAHEMTHALQDYNYDLESYGTYPDCEIDQQACKAFTSLVEGDATTTEWLWFQQYASPADLLDYYDYQPPALFLPDDFPPPYSSQDAYFPYIQGAEFVLALYEKGGWAGVNQAYLKPPTTTEQIIHPEKYFSGETGRTIGNEGLKAVFPEGWRLLDQDSLGEWMTYLVLSFSSDVQAAVDDTQAKQAADGWNGDQYQVYYNDELDQLAMAVQWSWDTSIDAQEFKTAIEQYLFGRFRGTVLDLGDGSSCWSSNGEYSCLYQKGADTLWIYSQDETLINSILSTYPGFK
ncbi:MAG: hypothetical protein JXA19_03245 [Anaerolineales bacterium]|nr:hypothetical protein [Anaerolineales bacterium]